MNEESLYTGKTDPKIPVLVRMWENHVYTVDENENGIKRFIHCQWKNKLISKIFKKMYCPFNPTLLFLRLTRDMKTINP